MEDTSRDETNPTLYEQCHTQSFLSTEPDTNTGYLLLIAMDVTKCSWASGIVRKQRCSLMSRTRMDLSSLHEIKYFPLGWNSTHRTQFSCAVNVIRQIPLRASHNLTVRSREADARYEKSSCAERHTHMSEHRHVANVWY